MIQARAFSSRPAFQASAEAVRTERGGLRGASCDACKSLGRRGCASREAKHRKKTGGIAAAARDSLTKNGLVSEESRMPEEDSGREGRGESHESYLLHMT